MTIKRKIYWSFFLLVVLFVSSNIFTGIILNNNKKIASHISQVVDPSQKAINEFEDMILESKMYSDNWVFMTEIKADKDSLIKIHEKYYPEMKSKLLSLSANWYDQAVAETLKKVLADFEQVLANEKYIMTSLQNPDDYNNAVKKSETKKRLEDIIFPQTFQLINSLQKVLAHQGNLNQQENAKLDRSETFLRQMTFFRAGAIILISIFLSVYLGKIILSPIRKIQDVVNDLGKGIINTVNHKTGRDEMGEMIRSVNTLSEKLRVTAAFANEIGKRNFNMPFEPMSNEDSLGKALIAMRDNLKSSDESLNEAQHIAHLGSWERDFKTKKYFWSDELFRVFDAESSDVVPSYESYFSFIHPEDRDYVNDVAVKYMEDRQPFSYECRLITHKGINKIICVEGKVIVDEQGDVWKTYGIVQDITERKQAEENLKQSESRLKEAQALAHISNWEIDLVRNIHMWSDEFYRIYGIKRDEVQPSPETFLSFMHPDDADFAKEKVGEAFATLKPTLFNFRFIRKDGAVRHGYTECRFEFDKTGKPLRLYGILQDITEQKQIEERLQRSEVQLKEAQAMAHMGNWDIDLANNRTIWSDEQYVIYGLKKGEVQPSAELFLSLMHPDDAEFAQKKVQEAFDTLKDSSFHFRFIRNGSEVRHGYVEWRFEFDKNNKPIRLYGIQQDITERKEAEKKLEQQNIELLKANSELDRFVYSASHDLRAPLTSMLGVIEISEEITGEDIMRKHLGMLKGSIKKLNGFIAAILDYSRNARTELDKEEIHFNELLNEITGNLKHISINNRETDIKYTVNNGITFRSDKNRLSVVLNNLISNAINYQNPEAKNPYVNVSVDVSPEECVIIVKDNGLGIGKEHQPKIFDMFYRVSGKSVGSGLGLYIVKEAIEKLNGSVAIESELGKGTIFNIRIPNHLN